MYQHACTAREQIRIYNLGEKVLAHKVHTTNKYTKKYLRYGQISTNKTYANKNTKQVLNNLVGKELIKSIPRNNQKNIYNVVKNMPRSIV